MLEIKLPGRERLVTNFAKKKRWFFVDNLAMNLQHIERQKHVTICASESYEFADITVRNHICCTKTFATKFTTFLAK